MATETKHIFRLGAVDRVSNTLKKISSRFTKLNKASRKASASFALMQRRTRALRRSLDRTGKSMRNLGGKMTRNVTTPTALAGAAVAAMGFNFEKSMNRVGALTSDISDGQLTLHKRFGDLQDLAKKLGSETAFSASQVADAMGFMAQAGQDANQIYEGIPAVLSLAAASNTELARTADIATNIMGAFGIEAKEMSRVADVLAVTTASTNVDMEQLADTMKTVAPIAAATGASLEETAAITGLLGNVGIQGTVAATSFKNIILGLRTPSSKASKFLKAMGVSTTTTGGQLKDTTQIMTELGAKLQKLPKDAQLAVTKELFGKFGIAGGLELTKQAAKGIENPITRMTKKIQGSKGAAKAMADQLQAGSVGAFKRFESAFEGMAIAIAQSGLLEGLSTVADFLSGVFKWVNDLNPSILKWVTVLILVGASIGPIIAGVGFLISGISTLITIGSVLVGIFTFLAGVLLTPIGLFVALGAAIGAVIFKWDDLVSAFKSGKGFLDTAGKLLNVFNPFSSDDDDKKRAPSKGAAAQKAGAKTGGNTTQTNNAVVDVNFANAPKGTKVSSSGKGLNSLNLGVSSVGQ